MTDSISGCSQVTRVRRGFVNEPSDEGKISSGSVMREIFHFITNVNSVQ